MRDTYQHGSRRRKVIRRRRILTFILTLIILAALIFCVIRFLLPALRDVTAPPQTEQETPQPEVPEVPEEPSYDYSSPVPESQQVTLKFFDDAVFIGNSRTQGLILYNAFSNCISFATKGLSLANIYTTEVTTPDNLTYPMMEALASVKCSKVYIMLGMNDMGWQDESAFGEKYGELIDRIKAAQPGADIYVQSVLPLTLAKEKAHPSDFTMERVNNYNTQLRTMCKEKQVYYVDVAACMTGPDGYLPDEAASDGVHLTTEYCKKWLAYLQNHVVLPEDYDGRYDVPVKVPEDTGDSAASKPTQENQDVTDFTK